MRASRADLEGGIEPELIGPFPNETARDEQAIALRNNKEDVILAVDGPGSNLRIEAYGIDFGS